MLTRELLPCGIGHELLVNLTSFSYSKSKMEFRSYKELVNTLSIGKQLPDAVYLHERALDTIPLELAADLARSVAALGLDNKEWNVIKFFRRDHKIALLNYPHFFEDAYPALEHAYTVDLERGTFRESHYRKLG